MIDGENEKVDEASRLVSGKTRRDALSTLHHFFDPRGEVETLAGNLPHWRQEGVLYFVTFRTADALPAEKLRQWRSEKDAWLAAHPEPWDVSTRHEYLDRFPRRLQRWLDAGNGECLLARSDLRIIVEKALRFFDGARYRLDEFVVAANHVHVLVAPTAGRDLSAIVQSWKSYSAKVVNRTLGRVGTFWQQEAYDHIVRDEMALHRIREYILDHVKVHEIEKVDEASRLVSGETRQDASST